MTNWYCDARCRISKGGAGPWSDNRKELFFNVTHAHSKCIGFQIIKPKFQGKVNWGHTDIEEQFGILLFQNFDELFHKIIASEKGTKKVCLIKDKRKLVN